MTLYLVISRNTWFTLYSFLIGCDISMCVYKHVQSLTFSLPSYNSFLLSISKLINKWNIRSAHRNAAVIKRAQPIDLYRSLERKGHGRYNAAIWLDDLCRPWQA